jgi:PAS domain S-box-containing protein
VSSVREDEGRIAPRDGDRRADQFHRLAAASLLLNSTLSLDELLQVITAQAREAVGAHQAITTMAVDGAWEHALTTVSLSEKYDEWRDLRPGPAGNGIQSLVCRENRPLRLTQAELEARSEAQAVDGRPPPRGWLGVPLVGRDGANLGLIELSDKADGGEFTDDDEAILVQLAQVASAAVENARLYESARLERDRLAAVHRLAEEIGGAPSLDQLFETALAGVSDAIGVARSAILLFDDEGVMRFRVWHGVSVSYRAAVEGYAPWRPDEVDAEPLLVPDVALEPTLRELLPALEAEGIRSVAFVPLVHGDRLIGTYMLAYAEQHEFGDDEVQVVRTIARHIASATGRRRAEAELRSSRAELQAILKGVADGISVQDTSGRVVYVNAAAARLTGFPDAESFLAASIDDVMARFELLDEERRPLDVGRLPGRAALRGEPASELVVCYRIRETGEERWSVVRAAPVHAPDGAVRLAINTFHDVTDRMRAEERLRFLSEASEILAGSLDFDETLAQLGRLMVPALADYCLVDLVQPDGSLRQVVLCHVDPQREEVLRDVRRLYPPQNNPSHPASEVLASGEPLLIETADEETLRRAATDQRHLDLYHALDPSSYLVVPLVARGRTLGTVSLGTGESGRHYGPDDVAFMQGVAGRIAVAVENARLYTEAGESLALLDTLLVSAPVGIGFWDRDLRFVRVNDALAAINGLPPEEHAGKTLAEVVPRLADRLEPMYRSVLETGIPLVHQESTDGGEIAPGSDRHWLSSYYPVRTEFGETIGVGAVIMEITDRKRAEDRLRLLAEAGELFSSSLDRKEIFARVAHLVVPRIADACNIFLAEGNGVVRVAYSHVDPERERLMAAMPDEYRFTRPRSPLLEQVIFQGQGLLVPTLTEEVVGDLEAIGLDRELFARVGSKSMIFVPFTSRGRTLGVMTLGSLAAGRFGEADLELAKELARRASVAVDNAVLVDELQARAQAAQALQFVGDGVFLLDSDGIVRLWNPAAAAMFGLLESDVVGRPLTEAVPGWLDVESLVPVAGPASRSARAETVPVELAGRELWLSISGVRFEEGTVYAFRDLTEERALERIKSDFVSTVSHELRTPLAAIYGAAMTLRRSDVPLSDDQREGMLGVVSSEAERLARIVNDILLASRLDSDVVDVAIDSADALALAKQVVAAAGAHLPPGIELSLRAPEDLPPISADDDKLRQVLVNLVENAIKYSPDGGLVEVELTPVPGRMRFSVRDRGLGIPPTEHTRIFEKFYRLDPDLTRGVGGTGLGLYICREIVRRMEGRIWVESSPGAGSTFTFELPLA